VRLATEGIVKRIELDTNHFKGNYPDTASIDGSRDGENWVEVLPRTKLQAHTRHFFIDELLTHGPFTHLRINVFPDGGVSRFRVWGVVTQDGRHTAVVRRLNTLFSPHELLKVCGSKDWALRMFVARPFSDWDGLIYVADQVWKRLNDDQWLEAFAAHPRIGDRKPGWSSQEQSGTSGASEETLRALAEGNRAYEEKFGFVFLICATGKNAEEILANLQMRLPNDRRTELENAAAEQWKIMQLRLEKLVM
jgi:allantoicase